MNKWYVKRVSITCPQCRQIEWELASVVTYGFLNRKCSSCGLVWAGWYNETTQVEKYQVEQIEERVKRLK